MPTLSNDWQPRDERDARIEELEAEVERSHKAILALTGENEQLAGEVERLRDLLGTVDLETLHWYLTCSEDGDNAERGCVACQIIKALKGEKL